MSRYCDDNRGTDSNTCHERRSKNLSMNIKSTWFQVDLLSRDFKKSCFGALVRWDEAMTLKGVLTAGDLTGVWNSKIAACCVTGDDESSHCSDGLRRDVVLVVVNFARTSDVCFLQPRLSHV